jgi:ribosomal protein L7Ae-like RNA K-turn-binding protein
MSGLLGLIGLGYRARNIAVGVDAVRKELQAGKCRCVVVAEDASRRAVDKVVRLAAARGVPLLTGPGAAQIGAQLGKPPVMAVGVRDRALAAGMVGLAPARTDGGLSGQDESSRSRGGVRRSS